MSTIRSRRWLVQEPSHWRVLGVFEAQRAEDACGAAARDAGLDCEAFHGSWLPGSRSLHDRGEGIELYATDVTGAGSLPALRALDEDVLRGLAEDADGDFYTARAP
ncbi:hypothetical protein [Aerolutibacter ruishenii]|uniref:Uncharacterized protein n=1 Tax=Aerolutibacter ruishenii TaxID=686800 RepID=A0A562LFG6_9GAMM|nr:hypothetical protein [Lysobacter ruishenii]TWI06351.1 hypothetical protein IP93_02971 [Lysobacter ruishenii]